ncbi:MAG: response regulator [Lachnospiraceae bacterium]|nr:response regulator [Lachnospiraceae bacterium]
MKILFIAEAQSFMVNAIMKNLKEANFEVEFVKPKVNDIDAVQKDSLIILMYLGDYVDNISETLVYIKDITVEGEKKLFLVGADAEVKTVKQTIPEQLITGVLARPLNVKELVDLMNDTVSDLEMREAKKHLLVVDDDPIMLRTIKEWLSAKYNVTMVNSGMNAITYLAKNRPDLVLLDYEMPVCSGPQTLEMMRSEAATSDIPVMFLTAKGDRESVMKVLALKPEGYLLKTMKPAEIIEALESFFEKKKMSELKRL